MNSLLAALEPLFAPAATVWGAPVTWLELVAFALAIAMVIFNIRGQRATPAVLTDDKGNCAVLDTVDNLAEERLARALSVAMGGVCHLIEYPAEGHQLKCNALRGTVSDALAIGRALRVAHERRNLRQAHGRKIR